MQARPHVLWSLQDELGQIVLDAISCGMPVLATNRTCASDPAGATRHAFQVPRTILGVSDNGMGLQMIGGLSQNEPHDPDESRGQEAILCGVCQAVQTPIF